MLDLMRKHAKNWLVKNFTGNGYCCLYLLFRLHALEGKAEAIAIIDGRVIPYAEFHKNYQKLLDAYRGNTKGCLRMIF